MLNTFSDRMGKTQGIRLRMAPPIKASSNIGNSEFPVVARDGAGTVPVENSGIADRVKKWIGEDKLVVLMSETKAGELDPAIYESGRKLLELGAVDSGDMTFEAAVTKVMFLLGQYRDISIIKKNFKNSLAGEIS